MSTKASSKFKYSIYLFIISVGISTTLFTRSSFGHIMEWSYPQGGEHVKLHDYIFDFGYSPLHPSPERITFLDFNLLNNIDSMPVEYDVVWVKISSKEQMIYSDGIQSDKILYSGQVKANNSNANFTFLFPKNGEYEITTLFYKDGQIIGEPRFKINVDGEDGITTKLWFTITIIVALLFFFLGILLCKRRNRGNQQS